MRNEFEETLGKRPPTISDVVNLNATRRVIEESMRLYPPVRAVPRHIVADGEIGGFQIPRGSMTVLVPNTTRRGQAANINAAKQTLNDLNRSLILPNGFL